MRPLTYNQLNLLETFATMRTPVKAEHLDSFDGRTYRRLLTENLIAFKKRCGCNHVCGCKTFVTVTEKGKDALVGFNYRTHKNAPGGFRWTGED